MLVPPENFGLVEPGIYRCSKLDSDNFPFLETLQLRSLVLLDAEKPPRSLNDFLQSNAIELFNLGGLKISNHHHTGADASNKDDDDDDEDERSSNTSKNSDRDPMETSHEDKNVIEVVTINTKKNKNDQWMLIEKNLISRAFELLLNKNKHNVLLVDSTSTLIGILRKIQKWNFNSILNEYRIYTGNSTKNNYFAETFLELIQTELIAYEIDHLNQQLKEQKKRQEQEQEELLSQEYKATEMLFRSPEFSKNNSRSSSINGVEEEIQWDEDDVNSIDDDDMDDDLLSASPQIPVNLLKLVEQRKQEKPRDMDSDNDITPGTSPKLGRTSRHNSFNNDSFITTARMNMDRRRSSIDSKFLRANNNKFRTQQSPRPIHPHRASFDSPSPLVVKKTKEKDCSTKFLTNTEVESIKKKYDYRYYKNLNKYPITFENVSVIKLKLPADSKLPDWFVRGRNLWEETYTKLNNV
ncbi:putative tyrosine phosphatase [Scheffersomyces xylosifermentans]|uniref:putative tyrosine phosphatase n=1 Tax=Scheffersomyces xylosifermentans TaxID=1304137 RepID=UPI00315D9625